MATGKGASKVRHVGIGVVYREKPGGGREIKLDADYVDEADLNACPKCGFPARKGDMKMPCKGCKQLDERFGEPWKVVDGVRVMTVDHPENQGVI